MKDRRRSKYRKRTKRKYGRNKSVRESSNGSSDSSFEIAPLRMDLSTTEDEQSIILYDEDLLERSRTQWHFGDWLSLAQLDLEILKNHPDRAQLALLAASGRFQTNEYEEAKKLIKIAKCWGASKQLICKVLVSGVYNSLGRAALLGNQEQRALPYFENAIALGAQGSEVRLLTKARTISQKEQILNLSRQLGTGKSPKNEITGIDEGASALKVDTEKYLNLKWGKDQINNEMDKIPKGDFVDISFDINNENETKGLFIIFSTPRCGSTLVCDLLFRNEMCLAHEYFQPYQYMPILAKRWGCIEQGQLDASRYIDNLCRRRTMNNGWLGMNIHASHIPIFVRMKQYFPHIETVKYIKVQRKDTIAQAVSFSIAMQSKNRPNNSDSLTEPAYDFKQINGLYSRISNENALIDSFLQKHRLECETFYYEDLVSDPSTFLSSLKNCMPNTKPLVTWTQLKRQSNKMNEAWVLRFEEDIFNYRKKIDNGFIEMN